MKKLLTLALAVLMCVFAISAMADTVSIDRTLELQFVPSKDADVIITGTKNLPELLKAALLEQGYDVKDINITVGTNYEATGEAMAAGTVDLGWLPGGTYALFSDDVDVIIDVADASALERNLYLTLQLIELGKPVILALNMMDIVEKRGMEIDTHRLPEMLGIPVIPVSARRKTGLDILMHAASHHKDHREDMPLIHHHHSSAGIPERGRSQTAQTRHSHHHHHHHHHQEYTMVYSDEIENKIDQLLEVLRDKYPSLRNPRWYAIKLLESDKEVLKQCPIDRPDILDRSYEQEIINQKYDFIDEIIQEVLVNKEKKEVFIGIGTKPACCNHGYGQQMLQTAYENSKKLYSAKPLYLEV